MMNYMIVDDSLPLEIDKEYSVGDVITLGTFNSTFLIKCEYKKEVDGKIIHFFITQSANMNAS
jgi:hypothetical protein